MQETGALENPEKKMSFSRKNQGTPPGGGTCSLGLRSGRGVLPPPTASCPTLPLSPMMINMRIQAFPLEMRKMGPRSPQGDGRAQRC